MLSLLTGSFRAIEDALVSHLRARPALEPAIVVVPGGNLAARLKRALAAAGGVAAVRILNFNSLARLIVETASAPVLPAVEELLEEEIFRAFLREPGAPQRYRKLADRAGASALLATLRDLRAAGATATELREVKDELEEDRQRLAELSRMVELYEEFLKRTGFTTRAAISRQAAGLVEGSAVVRQTPNWMVYGFYEFLGEQKELLDALGHAAEVTVYFPYREAKAWDYARKTLDLDFGGGGVFAEAAPPLVNVRSMLSRPPGGTRARKMASVVARSHAFAHRLFDPEAAPPKTAELPVSIVSAAGVGDEVWYAVKWARRLHEEEGIAWRDIAIICRNLEGRIPHADRIFREECVPWTTTALQSLTERPLAQAAVLALRIFLDDAYHLDVLEWFALPMLRAEVRADRWGAVARALGIVSGDDWKRLEAARGAPAVDAEGHEVAGPATVASFADAVHSLRSTLDPGGSGRTWESLAVAWRTFLEDRLDTGTDSAAWAALDEILRSLQSLDRAASRPSPASFASAFSRAVASYRIPAHPSRPDGVALLDAMSSRGHRFRISFLLGLNEGEWPRVPREDPFLPDASRRRLFETTGLRLMEKLEGSSEERMLFALAVETADRVVLVHRRVDDEGRREAPSAFVEEVKRVTPADTGQKIGKMPAKKLEWAAKWSLLTAEEMRLRSILTGGGDGDPAVAKARALEGHGRWTEYDVLSAPPAGHLEKVKLKGFSPTGLEALGKCPFQYWATRVAGLELLDPREAELDVEARQIGSILHAALGSGAEPLAAARELFAAEEKRRPPVRWGVWEAAREAGLRALEALVEHDRREREAEGWEVWKSEIELPFVAGPGALPGLHGRADRVERRKKGGVTEYRVTDFKYVQGKNPWYTQKTADVRERNILKDAAMGRRLQLLVYARLVAPLVGEKAVFGGAHYYFFGPRLAPVRQGLDSSDGATELESVAGRLWEVLSEGRFVVVDDDKVCGWCDAAAICRRGHFATRERALEDERMRAYREGRFA